MRLLTTLAVLPLLIGCGLSEEEVQAASSDAAAAALAAETKKELEKSQDFDAIAADSIAGVDTSGLDSLQSQ